MKIIESNGGPLIALNENDIARWGGIDRLDFFCSSKEYKTDYDHLCFEVTATGGLIVGKTSEMQTDVLVINYPVPTVIIPTDGDRIYLVQIDASEPGWLPDSLREADFERAIDWKDPFDITMKSGTIVFFDSACVEKDFRGDILCANLLGGLYRCDWSRQTLEGKADLNFIRIVKKLKLDTAKNSL